MLCSHTESDMSLRYNSCPLLMPPAKAIVTGMGTLDEYAV